MVATQAKASDFYRTQAQICRALNHPVRLAILDILRDGEQCVCHMEATLGLRQAYISQHLMSLREAGLVEVRRDGWNIFYRICEPRIHKVTDALNKISGRPTGRFPHVHAGTACPCPKCNS